MGGSGGEVASEQQQQQQAQAKQRRCARWRCLIRRLDARFQRNRDDAVEGLGVGCRCANRDANETF
ncbi:hypothetical protein Syun_003692 [Stephania yunnanensis]|uniref:Uncharacterized protein n=1 Tax=Stephania yunnanensis TaxID=152371 RepID=A0AAP0Q0T6_9MAGN